MNGFFNTRRLLGALFLLLAVAMLLAGETLLKQRLGPLATLLYWTAAIVATLAAIFCALLDLGRSMRDSHREQREMIEQTLHEIEAERNRRRPGNQPTSKSR